MFTKVPNYHTVHLLEVLFTKQQINLCSLKSFLRTKATSSYRKGKKRIHTYFPGTCQSQLLKQENRMSSEKLDRKTQPEFSPLPPKKTRHLRMTTRDKPLQQQSKNVELKVTGENVGFIPEVLLGSISFQPTTWPTLKRNYTELKKQRLLC